MWPTEQDMIRFTGKSPLNSSTFITKSVSFNSSVFHQRNLKHLYQGIKNLNYQAMCISKDDYQATKEHGHHVQKDKTSLVTKQVHEEPQTTGLIHI